MESRAGSSFLKYFRFFFPLLFNLSKKGKLRFKESVSVLMYNHYWENPAERTQESWSNARCNKTRKGKAAMICVSVLTTCCRTDKMDAQNLHGKARATLGSQDFKWILGGNKLTHNWKKKEEWAKIQKFPFKNSAEI